MCGEHNKDGGLIELDVHAKCMDYLFRLGQERKHSIGLECKPAARLNSVWNASSCLSVCLGITASSVPQLKSMQQANHMGSMDWIWIQCNGGRDQAKLSLLLYLFVCAAAAACLHAFAVFFKTLCRIAVDHPRSTIPDRAWRCNWTFVSL